MSSCFRKKKAYLGDLLAPTLTPLCSNLFQQVSQVELRCGQKRTCHNLRFFSIGYRDFSSTVFTSCLENQDAIFCLGQIWHCQVKAFAFNSAASTFDFESQGVTLHTGIKEDVLHWFLEWFFMKLFVCRCNPITYAFVMTLLSVIEHWLGRGSS